MISSALRRKGISAFPKMSVHSFTEFGNDPTPADKCVCMHVTDRLTERKGESNEMENKKKVIRKSNGLWISLMVD